MILPSQSDLPAKPHDYTIVGSGFAGLYLAEALSQAGRRVLVLEQGPLDDPLNEGEGYYEIDVTGLPYLASSERLAAFGGTSGHWGGMSRPLAPSVFADRPHLQCRGWPIAHADYARHLDAAKRWLGHTYGADDPGYDEPSDGFLPGPTTNLAVHNFVRAKELRRLGAERRAWAETSDMVDVLASHRVTNMVLDASGSRVASIGIVNMRSRETAPRPVETLILATGGIENARLMLSSGRTLAPGNPFAGRYGRTGVGFMEHPKFDPLQVLLDESFPLADTTWTQGPRDILTLRAYSVAEQLLEAHGVPRFAVFFWGDAWDAAAPNGDIEALDLALHGRARAYRISRPSFAFEQTPRDTSYIALSDRTDRYGEPLARMHWTIEEDQMRVFWTTIRLFANLISQCGAVRTQLVTPTFEAFAEELPVLIQHHHMGATAMSHDARTGVVDTNCRVHDLANLYVAGSSVFPVSDYVNPTLNLVALAARLAHHLTGSGD